MIRIFLALFVGSLGCSLFLPVSADAASAPTHQYLARVPQAGMSCDDAAKALGWKFAEAGNVRLVSSECRGPVSVPNQPDIQKIYSVLLTYEAKHPVRPTSVVIGPYHDYARCAEAVLTQESFFEHHTGQRAVTAICVPTGFYGMSMFQIEIEGLGKAVAKLFTFDARHLARSSELLARQGAVIVETTDSKIHYYAPSAIPLRESSMLRFPSQEACEAQLPEGEQMFNRLYQDRYELFCERRPYSPPNEPAWMNVVYSGNAFFLASQRKERYFSIDECLGDKQRVVDELTARNRPPLAVFCTLELGSGMTLMHLYYRF